MVELIDLDFAKKAYHEALEKGKQFVKSLEGESPEVKAEAAKIAATLQRLTDLRDEGLLSEEEFEEKKAQVLSRGTAAEDNVV